MKSPHKIDRSRLRVLESVFDDQMALIRRTEKNIEVLIDERVDVESQIRQLQSHSWSKEAMDRIGQPDVLSRENPNTAHSRAPSLVPHPDGGTRTPTLMQRIAGINAKIAALREEREAIEERLGASQGLFERCKNFVATGEIA